MTECAYVQSMCNGVVGYATNCTTAALALVQKLVSVS